MILLAAATLILLLISIYFIKRSLKYRATQVTFKKLIDHTNIGYYRYRNRDGVILAANRGFVNILDLDAKPREIIGRSISELLVYVNGEESIRKKLKEKGELRNYEYRFRTLKGHDKYVLHNSYMTRDAYNREEVIEALIEDVTEQRVSYEKMRESQQWYEKLFKNSGDMVIIFRMTEEMIINEVNPVTEVITGFTSEEITGMSFERLVHPSGRRALKECRDDLMFRGSSRLDTVIVCKNGTYREVIVTLSSVELEGGDIVMAVIKDVSALVKEREETRRRKAELEDFWKASVEREERIKDLRQELERVQQQGKLKKRETWG